MDLLRAARPTRGQRLTKLVDDEIEADNAFWSQDAFKEEAQDREYEQEAEQADEFDSDFDEEEPTSDEEGQEEKELVKKKKKKLPYKKPGADKKRKSVSFLLSAAAIGRTDKSKSKKKASRPSQRAEGDVGEEENVAPQEEGERTVRKSTRTSVVVKQAERDAIRAALQATPKPVKKKKGEEKKMSQEDMLLEAAQTEVINLQSLERMLAREEEVKKKAIIQKKVYTGPQIRFISKDGYNVLEFTKVHTFPSTINSKAKPYPERALCVVTGQPAKYKDPKTGLPYATKEAFKIIRERFVKGDKSGRKDPWEETHQRKRTKVETERVSRAGVAKVKFKRTGSSSSTKDSPLATTTSSPASAAPSPPLQPRVQAAPLPPVQIEEVDEADFMLEDLDVNAPWTCNYETGFRAMINAGYEPDEILESKLGFANSNPAQRLQSYFR